MLLSVPPIVVIPPLFITEVINGKFCRLLGPVSTSPASFSVTPLAIRSTPRPVFEKIELPRIAFPGAVVDQNAASKRSSVEGDHVPGAGTASSDRDIRSLDNYPGIKITEIDRSGQVGADEIAFDGRTIG